MAETPAGRRNGPLLVVMQQGEDVLALELVAALEEVEFDDEAEAADLGVELLGEVDGGVGGTAGGQQVVHDDDALPALDGVLMHLEGVGAVLQRVAVADG